MRDRKNRAGELLGASRAALPVSLTCTRMLARLCAIRQPAGKSPALVSRDHRPAAGRLHSYRLLPDAALRLRLYRRMAGLATMDEVDAMAEELADRFGPIPDPVDNLLYQLRVKVLAGKAGVSSVTVESGQIRVRVPGLDHLPRYRLQRYLGEVVRVSRKAVWFGRDLSTNEWKIILVRVLEKLELFRKELLPGLAWRRRGGVTGRPSLAPLSA